MKAVSLKSILFIYCSLLVQISDVFAEQIVQFGSPTDSRGTKFSTLTLENVPSYGKMKDPSNRVLPVYIGRSNAVDGIGWDVEIENLAANGKSRPAIRVHSADGADPEHDISFVFTPSVLDRGISNGTLRTYSTDDEVYRFVYGLYRKRNGEVVNHSQPRILPDENGMIYIEFFELSDEPASSEPKSRWTRGSIFIRTAYPVPYQVDDSATIVSLDVSGIEAIFSSGVPDIFDPQILTTRSVYIGEGNRVLGIYWDVNVTIALMSWAMENYILVSGLGEHFASGQLIRPCGNQLPSAEPRQCQPEGYYSFEQGIGHGIEANDDGTVQIYFGDSYDDDGVDALYNSGVLKLHLSHAVPQTD